MDADENGLQKSHAGTLNREIKISRAGATRELNLIGLVARVAPALHRFIIYLSVQGQNKTASKLVFVGAPEGAPTIFSNPDVAQYHP